VFWIPPTGECDLRPSYHLVGWGGFRSLLFSRGSLRFSFSRARDPFIYRFSSVASISSLILLKSSQTVYELPLYQIHATTLGLRTFRLLNGQANCGYEKSYTFSLSIPQYPPLIAHRVNEMGSPFTESDSAIHQPGICSYSTQCQTPRHILHHPSRKWSCMERSCP